MSPYHLEAKKSIQVITTQDDSITGKEVNTSFYKDSAPTKLEPSTEIEGAPAPSVL